MCPKKALIIYIFLHSDKISKGKFINILYTCMERNRTSEFATRSYTKIHRYEILIICRIVTDITEILL